jgi:hypothetical protein
MPWASNFVFFVDIPTPLPLSSLKVRSVVRHQAWTLCNGCASPGAGRTRRASRPTRLSRSAAGVLCDRKRARMARAGPCRERDAAGARPRRAPNFSGWASGARPAARAAPARAEAGARSSIDHARPQQNADARACGRRAHLRRACYVGR